MRLLFTTLLIISMLFVLESQVVLDYVQFRTAYNKFVCVNSQNQLVQTTSQTNTCTKFVARREPSQWFRPTYSFRTEDNYQLRCTKLEAYRWEWFTLYQSIGQSVLRTWKVRYWGAEANGQVGATRNTIGSRERFHIIATFA